MSSSTRVALVTGASKGVGFAIVRELCRQFQGDVVLTAPDEAQGRAAVQQLQAEGLSPRFHQLDIDDRQSIRAVRDFLSKEYGGLDVLVNNAGVAFKTADTTPFHIQAEVTMKTNFFGTRDVCTELLPLIKPQGRVVNVSSSVSVSSLKKCSPELQQKFRSETITEEELVGLMNKFVEDTKNGAHRKEGWPDTAYGVTKIGVTVLSRIHARKLSEQRGGDKILLNACCPGWLDITDLQSIRTLCDFLHKEYRGLNVLVNNTAIAFKSRVVNMSSGWGFKALESCSPELQQKLRSETITEEELVGLMNKFVEDTKNGVHRKEGWPDNNTYGVVKTGITALSRIQARKLSEQRGGDKILLNACCPGWVRTDMGGSKAPKSLEEGIETPVYLALLPSDAEGPHGQFVHEKKVAKWQFMPEFYP
ncbi:hypothetical protein MJT46_000067 [Ovis ammon polii x Ovis aries]|nr:hypothetical protein MJT46_000067 [Ovis ammon polii x Ovis aries]